MRDAALRERFTALRVEQNLQETDARRRPSHSDLVRKIELNGWNLLQRGVANDGTALWLLRAPPRSPQHAAEQNAAVQQMFDELHPLAALNGVAAEGTTSASGMRAAKRDQVPVYPADPSFYAGVSAAERIRPGGVSVILTAPGSEPPADATLRHVPTVLARVVQPQHYEADWQAFADAHPQTRAFVHNHLNECRRRGLISGQQPPPPSLGERTVERAINRARKGVSTLPRDYFQRAD